ncbi:unnamed protein product [Danaus chrysippus]|uniref:(African queen) hypothetical protein n=1 Tax=Danaus chrysippus TaxID=151541 RepID=A0A8J2W645_9NEOP|nr:unnamed protein product [Danaus chrysippus]
MSYMSKLSSILLLIVMSLYLRECTKSAFQDIDNKYYLVNEAHSIAKDLFTRGSMNYDILKNTSLYVMDTFLDLVQMMNTRMSQDLRSAVIKFYRIKNFHDFTNYMISLEEMVDIIEHCLMAPVETIDVLREQFRRVIGNFEDVRQFDTVNKCHNELPDEVAVAHCILHQAVLFNETMQDNLVSIVEIKTYQHARKTNASLYNVQNCLNSFVPNFFEQLLVGTYTDKCGYLKIVNASIKDLIGDEWGKSKDMLFPKKWSPLITILKQNSTSSGINAQQFLFKTLLAANLTSQDIIKTLYS